MDATSIQAVGIICEFNPFHNGHAHLISQARALVGDAGCVVCVMSGRTTQRGDLAIADPYLRAQTAICGGADLVVELPYPWCSGSAETFARAGIHILCQMGVQHLMFGSECGKIELLRQVAEWSSTLKFTEQFKNLCKQGVGTSLAYISAISQFAELEHTPLPAHFPSANDLLGIAYMAALKDLPITPHTIPRLGQGYNEEILTNIDYPSATALRALIKEASDDTCTLRAMLDGCMPTPCLDALINATEAGAMPIQKDKLLPLYHAYFRLTSPNTPTAEVSGGLANHLLRVAHHAPTPQAFWEGIQTKQYTNARLRRGMLFALTDVRQEDLSAKPTYTTLWAANSCGCTWLSKLKKKSSFPLVTKPADAPSCRQKELCHKIDALFTLCFPQPLDTGALMRMSPYIEK